MLILISLILSSQAHAELGVSAFAIKHNRYPCRQFLKIFNGSRIKSIAVLESTFGNKDRCFKRFLTLPGKKIVSVHLINETGRRNSVLSDGELSRYKTIKDYEAATLSGKALKPFIERLVKWRAIASQYPDVSFRVSDGLESNPNIEVLKIRQALIKSFKFKSISNPLTDHEKVFTSIDPDFIELHTTKFKKTTFRKRCIINNDGRHINYSNSTERKWISSVGALPEITADEYASGASKMCKVVYLWDSQISNGRERKESKFITPRLRNFKFNLAVIKTMNKLLIKYNGSL